MNKILFLILGSVLFLVLFGFKIVNPFYTDWNTGDSAQHFLGWLFFRNDEWRFPLGIIKNYNYPIGTSIVFMDSIPILAVLLKPFSQLLPQNFQYLGIWMLISYMLQSLFAYLLLKKFNKDSILIFLGVIFFVLSPIMFIRSLGHEALTSHWTILFALYLYFSENCYKIRLSWILLIIISSSIHAYLLLMVLAIWVAFTINIYIQHKNTITIIKFITTTLSLLMFSMFILGYFINYNSIKTDDFGLYSMNLTSIFNPTTFNPSTAKMEINTFFFRNFHLPVISIEQWEGFNYLGLGMILIFTISLFLLKNIYNKINIKNNISIIIILFIMFVFSLSDTITFLDYTIFQFKYPKIIDDIANIFRASGRMFWPLYYLIILFSITIIIKEFKKKKAFFVLFFCLIIQTIDLYPWYKNINNILSTRTRNTILISSIWSEIAKQIKYLTLIPGHWNSDIDFNFAIYAANNKLYINTGYVARGNISKIEEYNQRLENDFLNNKIDSKTAYIIHKNYNPIPKNINFIIIDGQMVVIPKDLKISFKNESIIGRKLNFNSREIILKNFSDAEPNHIWSEGEKVSILFPPINKNDNPIGKIKIVGFTLDKQKIGLMINDELVSYKTFNIKNNGDIVFDFNPCLLKSNEYNKIELILPNSKKPNNNDQRYLSIALKYILIE